jgi:hypothetical protein
MKFLLTTILLAGSAFAGLPLICHPIEIGNAKSLPWKGGADGWEGADRSYDRSRLATDTLALLTPGTPVAVRMETMRRAAIYAREDPRIGADILLRLTAIVLDGGAADSMAWFDAGYFAETLRQMARTQEKDTAGMRRGSAWVRHAIRLGGKGMEDGLARTAD